MRFKGMTAACMTALMACGVVNATVIVTNYSWLQLPRTSGWTDPLSFNAGTSGSTVSFGYGSPANFRWGSVACLPSQAMTDSGADNYWFTLGLDQARNVQSVRVQWHADHGTGVRQFTIQGSTDGLSFSNIGSLDYGVMRSDWADAAGGTYSDVPVVSGSYKAVRVLLTGGNYQASNDSTWGGPGLDLLEPFGNGSVPEDQVNWANAQFSTSVTANVTYDQGGSTLNNGSLYDAEGGNHRAGSAAPWPSNHYVLVNLGQKRSIDHVVGIWENYQWAGTGFQVWTSTDGTTFTQVTGGLSGQAIDSSGIGNAGNEYFFNPVDAQYVQIRAATSGVSIALVNQVLVYGPAIPEPASLSLLALGGLALIRRRKQTPATRQDQDGMAGLFQGQS